jgi:actin related protein 2/3 complex subunit 1A/1B
MDILWITDNSFIAAGHDYAPFLFSVNGGAIAAGVSLDQKTGTGAKAAGGPSNMSQWQNRDKLGAADGDKDQNVDTKHQNCVTTLQIFKGTAAKVAAFSTSGLDGSVGVWDLDGLSKAISGLKIN